MYMYYSTSIQTALWSWFTVDQRLVAEKRTTDKARNPRSFIGHNTRLSLPPSLPLSLSPSLPLCLTSRPCLPSLWCSSTPLPAGAWACEGCSVRSQGDGYDACYAEPALPDTHLMGGERERERERGKERERGHFDHESVAHNSDYANNCPHMPNTHTYHTLHNTA